ncbi:MAG: sigma 54-interacting transcriptional regulator [Clostridiales bacterium]|nr:sigma 54-interacting transcriptional regulator [Clostridiales bacterium]
MVKIRVFIPHLELKEIFEQVVAQLPKYDNIQIETTYVFGTPVELSQNWDAEILVARGMTYDALRELFPTKHVVQIRLSSFDIFAALVKCRDFQAKRIALFLHDIRIPSLPYLEELCGAPIMIYDAPDEKTSELSIRQAVKDGADIFVGAGTVCGICDRMGLRRVHIHTKYAAVEMAMQEAVETAKTINYERTRSDIFNTMLNYSEDGIIAVNENGRILSINNQAYLIFQLSTVKDMVGQPISSILQSQKWKSLVDSGAETEQLIKIHEKNYYVRCNSLSEKGQETGALFFVKNADRIIEEESKIRRGLSEKGLTAKYSFKDILGQSDAIRDNIRIAERYSRVNSNVLIIGETGTGKELFAHSIHQASKRSNQPFVALNCAALPENLLESELFGYEPGAFSGASKGGKIGLFELAHKGTIFLDEIGEIPIALQAKLLRVLQEKEIRRIGSTSVHPVDVRVISATNIDIEKKIEEGEFRSDLYYRLNLLDIYIPPLRERKEDIQELIDFYLASFACEMGKSIPKVTPEAAKIFNDHSWPGNVRELRNICERLTVLNDTNVIDENLLYQLKIFRRKAARPTVVSADPDSVYSRLQPKKKKKDLAEELGVSRTTLWRMAKRQNELEKRQMGRKD